MKGEAYLVFIARLMATVLWERNCELHREQSRVVWQGSGEKLTWRLEMAKQGSARSGPGREGREKGVGSMLSLLVII